MASNTLHNLLPDAALFGSIILAYVLDKYIPLIDIVPFPINTVGLLMAACGLGVAVRVLSQLRHKRTSTNAADLPAVLITNGIYAISRNPFYLACFCLVAGIAVYMGSLAALAAPALYFIIIQAFIIPLEESKLRASFGREYDQYKHNVRRWL